MPRCFDHSTAGWLTQGALVTAVPFTMAGWYYPLKSTTGFAGMIFSIGTAGSNDQRWSLEHGASQMIFRVRTTSSLNVVTTTSPVPHYWNHIAGIEGLSNIDHRVFLNGERGSSVANRAPSGVNETIMGKHHDPTANNAIFGYYDYWTVWNITLEDADIKALYCGADPMCMRPDAIVASYRDLMETCIMPYGSTIHNFTPTNLPAPVNWQCPITRRAPFNARKMWFNTAAAPTGRIWKLAGSGGGLAGRSRGLAAK